MLTNASDRGDQILMSSIQDWPDPPFDLVFLVAQVSGRLCMGTIGDVAYTTKSIHAKPKPGGYLFSYRTAIEPEDEEGSPTPVMVDVECGPETKNQSYVVRGFTWTDEGVVNIVCEVNPAYTAMQFAVDLPLFHSEMFVVVAHEISHSRDPDERPADDYQAAKGRMHGHKYTHNVAEMKARMHAALMFGAWCYEVQRRRDSDFECETLEEFKAFIGRQYPIDFVFAWLNEENSEWLVSRMFEYAKQATLEYQEAVPGDHWPTRLAPPMLDEHWPERIADKSQFDREWTDSAQRVARNLYEKAKQDRERESGRKPKKKRR